MIIRNRCAGIALLLLSLCLLFFIPAACSQPYSYKNYDFKDGLPGATVHGMAQDHNGFIWITTETGLSVFDGARFRNFRREDGLPSNEVFSAFVDSRNRVWLTTYKNAICYVYKGKIHNQYNDPVLKKINLECEVVSLGEDAGGNIIVLSEGGHFIIAPDGKLSRLSRWAPADSVHFRVVAGAGFRFHWRMANTRYVPSREASYVPHARDRNFSSSNDILLFKYPGGAYVVRNDKVIDELQLSEYARVKAVDDSVIAILGDTVSGAFFYNVNRRKYIERYLPGYTVHDVFRDIEGNLWFSTKESGVFKLNPAAFQTFSFRKENSPVAIVSLFTINKRLFANTGNNECWQLSSVHPLRFVKLPSHARRHIPVSLAAQGRCPQMIVYTSSDFLHLNRRGMNVKSVVVTGDSLLISTNDNVQLVHYPDLKMLAVLRQGRSTCSFKIGKDYYVGTLGGLYRIDSIGRQHYVGEDYAPLRDRISSFACSDDGTLWIATYENGIVGYKDGKVVVNITREKNGLSSNICRCICSYGNTLWIGTEKGLNKVEKTKDGTYRTTQKFTMADGLTSDIVNAVYVDSNRVFAGTSDGIVHFDNAQTRRHSLCRLYMTDIKVSDQPLNIDTNRFRLSPDNNNISFEFAAISFLSEDDITYSYRLAGLDNTWRKAEHPALAYPSLPFGKYRLEVVAINKFGDSSALLTRNFEVQPRLSERKGVQTLSLLVLAGCCALIIHLRLKVVHKKNHEKNEIRRQMMSLEQAALRAQMNPHFIFNCLNSIQHYIIRRDMMQVSVYLSKFANLVRQTLDNAPRLYLLLREEVDYLENYIALEKMQVGDALEYSIWVDPALDMENVQIPNMIIQPFVENAIKHGVGQLSAGAVLRLLFLYLPAEQLLRCVIEDNGPGIRFTQELQQKNKRRHTPKGLLITKERIETLSQIHETKRKITIRMEEITPDAAHKGARIIIDFPL